MQLQKILVVLGPPGSGKGTQSALLAQALNYEQIVLGDLIREFIKGTSPEAIEAKARYDQGIPQPDEIATGLLKAKLTHVRGSEGAVFDTFPLSIGQAQAVDEIVNDLKINSLKVFFLNVNKEEVVKRIEGRKTCSLCKNVTLPGQSGYEENACANCGGELIIRSDDTPEIARARFEEYEKRNAPIKEFYKAKGILVEINGDQPVEAVHEEITQKLGISNK